MSQSNQPRRAVDDDEEFIQQLAWKMLDGVLDEEEAEQLDLLLTHSEAARQTYVKIVQLHVDLLDHFKALPKAEDLVRKAIATDGEKPAARKTASPPAPPNPPAPAIDEIPTSGPTGG